MFEHARHLGSAMIADGPLLVLAAALIGGVGLGAIGWLRFRAKRVSPELTPRSTSRSGEADRAEEHQARDRIPIHESMLPIDQRYVVGTDARIGEVVERLRTSPTGFVLVESEGRLIGVLTIEDLGHWLRRRDSPVAAEDIHPDSAVHPRGDRR